MWMINSFIHSQLQNTIKGLLNNGIYLLRIYIVAIQMILHIFNYPLRLKRGKAEGVLTLTDDDQVSL
jgi:hypothetical protein